MSDKPVFDMAMLVEVRRGQQRAFEEAAQICDEQADLMDGRIPSAHGGMFAKKLAANALRGTAALIRKKARGCE